MFGRSPSGKELERLKEGSQKLRCAYEKWDIRHRMFSILSTIMAMGFLAFSIIALRSLGKVNRPSRENAPHMGGGRTSVERPFHPAAAVLLFGWVIGPPTWLVLEYMIFSSRLDKEAAEHLRHFEELTRNLWLAIVAGLVALYLRKIPLASE